MNDLGNIQSRLLVFGGPYSNLAATSAMYSIAKELEIDTEHTICTGDLVAYCAEPQQTVDLIRNWGVHVVMGNCEESLAMEQTNCGCGFVEGSTCSALSEAWYAYANRYIDHDGRQWMQQLPGAITFKVNNYRFRIVHGSVTSINQFIFSSTPNDIKQAQIVKAEVEVVIGGHSGIPFGQYIGDKLWLNAGVIGLPANDGSSDGWYMLLDPGDGGIKVSWHRLQYDASISSRSTRIAGMPQYARALTDGLWPSMDILPEYERSKKGVRLSPASLQIITG